VAHRIIVQAVSAGGPVPDVLPPSVASFHLLLVLKSGFYKGNATVKLAIQSPSGVSVGESSVDIFFEGDDRGVNLVSPMQLQVSEGGLYWIDVHCTVGSAESFFTRIPLRPRRVAVPDFEPTESEAILRAMRDPEDPLRFPNPRGEGDEEHGHDGLHREAA